MHRTLTYAVFALAGIGLLVAKPALRGQSADARPAYLTVQIPANAELTVDGIRTKQMGEVRNFVSPPLNPGRNFVYIFRATWKEGGKEVSRERKVRVQAGAEMTVDLLKADDGKEMNAGAAQPAAVENPPAASSVPAATDDDKGDRTPDVVFVPTPQEVVDKMLEMAQVKKGDVLYDLGCGDGRIVVTAAKKFQAKSTGFDIDPQRVKESVENVKKNHVEDLATIKKADIFTLDLSDVNVVTLYLLPDLNVKLMPQLEKLKPGSRIVSHDFDMKGAKPKEVVHMKAKNDSGIEGEHTIYLWVVPWEKE